MLEVLSETGSSLIVPRGDPHGQQTLSIVACQFGASPILRSICGGGAGAAPMIDILDERIGSGGPGPCTI
jgi:hypothetical protein